MGSTPTPPNVGTSGGAPTQYFPNAEATGALSENQEPQYLMSFDDQKKTSLFRDTSSRGIWEGKGRPVDQKECSQSQTVRNGNDFSILKTEHDSLVVGDRPNLEAILTEWGLTRQIWNKANVDSQIRLLAAAGT